MNGFKGGDGQDDASVSLPKVPGKPPEARQNLAVVSVATIRAIGTRKVQETGNFPPSSTASVF